MKLDRNTAHLAEDVRVAVRAAVASDPTALIRITATLPLSSLAYWERLIRNEYALAPRNQGWPWVAGWRARLPWTHQTQVQPQAWMDWLDLASFDGYARERALQRLTGPAPNSFFFALAARRLNDWVPQVRAAANKFVPALAQRSDPEHVAGALCAMLPQWAAWGRAEAADRQVLTELARSELIAKALQSRVTFSSAGPMAAVLSQCLRTDAFDARLAEIATLAIQPSVRAHARRALLNGKAVWCEKRQWKWTDIRYCQGRLENVLGERSINSTPALVESLNAAAADRSSVVRRVAAEVLIREMSQLGAVALPLARRLAGDRSKPVAERGEFALQGLGAMSGP